MLGVGDKTVYTVNYSTGSETAPGSKMYKLTVTSVTITGSSSLYSVGDKGTTIGTNNSTAIVSTGGYITYNLLLSSKTIIIAPVDLTSFMNSGIVRIDYTYQN